MGNKKCNKKNNKLSPFSRSLISGGLFGIGFVAFMDEAVFHQILHWHHFYDKSTTAVGLVSDGFFHAFSWFATIGGLFMLADLRRHDGLLRKGWWSGLFLGGGMLQFYDGTVQHKLLRIHQIRYVENVFIYDLVWNIIAFSMIVLGAVLLKQQNRELKQRKENTANEPS